MTGFRFPGRGRFYSSPTHPPIQLVQGSGLEADHLTPSAEVKNPWSATAMQTYGDRSTWRGA
jgi:hypothetical protein